MGMSVVEMNISVRVNDLAAHAITGFYDLGDFRGIDEHLAVEKLKGMDLKTLLRRPDTLLIEQTN